MTDIDLDFSEDFRVYLAADGSVLLPDLFDAGYDRVIRQAADGMWIVQWASDGAMEPGRGAHDTVEEAMHAALGDPVPLVDVAGDGSLLSMTFTPRSYDQEFEILVRPAGGPYPWEAVVNTREVFPKHRYGDTHEEALFTLFGVTLADYPEDAGDFPDDVYMLLDGVQRG
jgi:hypothetical protein